jgi:hypothetical protein
LVEVGAEQAVDPLALDSVEEEQEADDERADYN